MCLLGGGLTALGFLGRGISQNNNDGNSMIADTGAEASG